METLSHSVTLQDSLKAAIQPNTIFLEPTHSLRKTAPTNHHAILSEKTAVDAPLQTFSGFPSTGTPQTRADHDPTLSDGVRRAEM